MTDQQELAEERMDKSNFYTDLQEPTRTTIGQIETGRHQRPI